MERFQYNYHDEYEAPSENDYRNLRDSQEWYISPDYYEAMERLVDPEVKQKVLIDEQRKEREKESWYGNIEI